MQQLDRNPGCATPALKQQFVRRARLPEHKTVLWRIESGIVCSMTWTAEGELACLGYWEAGDVVGHRLSRVQPYELHCLTDVVMELWFFEQVKQAVQILWQGQPLILLLGAGYG